MSQPAFAMPPFSPLVADTGSPPIPEAQGWARAYDGALGPLIDLSQAAPGHAPDGAILEALGRAARDPSTARYGPIVGDPAFRAAYAADLAQVYGAAVAPDEIAITTGCNLAFFVTAMAIAKAGENIVLPAPWYFNHRTILDMLGIGTVPLPCRAEDGFVPEVGRIAAAIDAKTRAVVLVSPNNPCGAVYPAETIRAVFDLCRARGIFLILDETYRDFLPEGLDRAHDLYAIPGWQGTLIDLYSFSKAYCVPGYRLGAIAAGRATITQIGKVLDNAQICAPRIGQVALAESMARTGGWRQANRAMINARAGAFRRAVAAAPGWRIDSIGAYFAYLAHPFAGATGVAVAERLARGRGVLALPGAYFGPGQERHLRFAFANADEAALAMLGERLAGLEMG